MWKGSRVSDNGVDEHTNKIMRHECTMKKANIYLANNDNLLSF